MLEITETLYATTPVVWRRWLQKNYDKNSEIWLIFPNKASDRPRISYNDAVEQALCFGWIDSIVKKFDDQSTAQRFTPRKIKGKFSQPNIERLRYLAATQQLMPFVLEQVRPELEKEFVFPKDIVQALRKNPTAHKFFNSRSALYQRVRVAYIEAARNRPEEFKKRLNNLITTSEKHKELGYGGIDKYY